MKYNKLFLMILSLICVIAVTSFAYIKSYSTNELTLEIGSPKNVYKLGETIDFSFKLNNNLPKPIVLLDVFGTGTGYLHLKVSKDGSNFAPTDDPGWGTLDTTGKTYLKPNEKAETNATVLWNLSSQETARFKFSEPGIYYFKAYYTARLEGGNSPIKLESGPIQITIENPAGEDLEIWNKLKNNGEFAYFIQEGDFRNSIYKVEERMKLQSEVEQIITQYPNSFYARLLQQSLDKFKIKEEKRKESMKDLKQP